VADRELIRQVAEGNNEAFRALYDRFIDRVFRYAYMMLRNRHLAEEVAQETMIAVWTSASRFAGRSKVSTWIFGIARNQALRLLRKEERGSRVPNSPLITPDPSRQAEHELRIAEAMRELPDPQREVVFLTFYEGLSYQEIAAIQDVPHGTVKSRMFHAKRKLAEVLT
jgi:RNA polymerase sigma-70 factor (ECF subfamily)